MDNKTTAGATKAEREVTYTPFGANVAIKINPSIVRAFLCKPSKKGNLPTDVDCYRYIAFCQAKLMNPFERDCFLVGYDNSDGTTEWSEITAEQLFLKRAELNKEYDGKEAGVTVVPSDAIIDRMQQRGLDLPLDGLVDLKGDLVPEGCTLVGGWCRVDFKTRKTPEYQRLSLQVFFKETKFWNRDTAGMIAKCATVGALRSAFPTMLGGLYTEGELYTRTIDVESRPSASAPVVFIGQGGDTPKSEEPAKPVETKTAEMPPKPRAKATTKPAAAPAETKPAEPNGIENTRASVKAKMAEDGIEDMAILAWGSHHDMIADTVENFEGIEHKALLTMFTNWNKILPELQQIQAELAGGGDPNAAPSGQQEDDRL